LLAVLMDFCSGSAMQFLSGVDKASRSAQRAGTSPYEDPRVIWAPTLAPKVGAFSFAEV
jgi:hypothetical protein